VSGWRITLALVLLGLVGLPAALPFFQLVGHAQGWEAWAETGRLLSLAGYTLALAAGTVALALPVGLIGAILLYRTDLPFRRALRFFVLVTLFIPLPLFTTAWQASLGTGGWLPVTIWNQPPPAGDPDLGPTGIAWKRWAHGLDAAIWVNVMAGLPWVIVLIGQGLRWVEPELEEEALTVTGPWRVLWSVTLPRSWAAICAAGLWVALFAATEITVTDVMQVRTFAEEVYTQLVVGDRVALAHAVAVALPGVALAWLLVMGVTRRWERSLPPLDVLVRSPRLLPLGKARWPCLLLIVAVVAILLGVPVASLIWKAGVGGSPQAWSASRTGYHLATAFKVRGGMVLQSFLLAALSGGVTAVLALLACWLAVGSRWFHAATLSLMAVVWALSGPILGLGLKECIAGLISLTRGWYPLAEALYYGPSPIPAVWAHLARLFPCAVAILWPVVRLIPRELRDAARVDGARPQQELRHIVLPLTLPAFWRAAFAVAVLSLGEVSASKLVETPGSRTFGHEIFDLMHFGVTNDLAALCLLLLTLVLCGGALVGIWGQWGARPDEW
jgi:iron(III) transport system permease protein